MFKGSNVALVTPFKGDSLDEETYIKIINFHLENGTNGLVLSLIHISEPTRRM